MDTPANAPLIELRGITRVYGTGDAEVKALGGISLAIDAGELVAVMGPSGSGKSTCMNVLGCLDTPTSGEYLFSGVDLARLDMRRRALFRRHYLGFVFQGFNLLSRTSALENVVLPLLYRGVPAAKRRAKARDALHLVGLDGREHHAPNELSGGQQQRVAIARAIVSDPVVLLADEPTGNLDRARSREILELLVRLNEERGLTVIMVTHDPVLTQFLVEAVALSSFGGAVGIALALAASVVLAGVLGVPFVLDPTIVAVAFLFSAGVGMVFGYFPARKAAQLDPIEALRYE